MRAAALALVSAALFGASTPFAKQFLASAHPVVVAGLLYLGSGVGLLALWLARGGARTGSGLARVDWPWLALAILLGGAVAPVLLMLGLQRTPAADASLLLNLESVLTAVFAWVAFREATDRRIVLGMLLIVLGGVVLAWQPGEAGRAGHLGAALVAAACVCWALDNNLTRMVAGGDALFIAGLKGAVAGSANLALAPRARRRAARAAHRRRDDAGRPRRLWRESRAVHPRPARPRHGPDRRVLLHCALHRCRRGDRRLRRARFDEPLGRRRAHGGRRVPPSHRAPPTQAHARAARAHALARPRRAPSARARAPGDPRRPHSHAHEHPVLTHSHPHYPDIHHRHRH